MENKFLLGVLVAIVLFSGVVAFKNTNVVVSVPEQKSFAGSGGADSFFERESHNGVGLVYSSVGFNTASSTVCSIKSPSVDSRLQSLSVRFTTVPSYATSYMLGSGTKNATTTSVIAVTQMAYVASATNQTVSASSTASILYPANTYLNLNLSTSTGATVTAATFPITGKCTAIFTEI